MLKNFFATLILVVAAIVMPQVSAAQTAADCMQTYQSTLATIAVNEATVIQQLNAQEASAIAIIDQGIIDITQIYIEEYANCQTQQCRDSLWNAFQTSLNNLNNQKSEIHEIYNAIRAHAHELADDARNQALKDYLECLNCIPAGGEGM